MTPASMSILWTLPNVWSYPKSRHPRAAPMSLNDPKRTSAGSTSLRVAHPGLPLTVTGYEGSVVDRWTLYLELD